MLTQCHDGNRAEFLATYALSSIGYVSPVPRQSDSFKVDLFVHLASEHGKSFIPLGMAFAAQLKSSPKSISICKPHAVNCFYQSQLPYFVFVVETRTLRLRAYSTIERILNSWVHPGKPVTLHLGPPPADFTNDINSPKVHLYLGMPILEMTLHPGADGTSDERCTLWRKVLWEWALFESIAIAWQRDGLPASPRPSYTTNAVPELGEQGIAYVYPDELVAHAAGTLGKTARIGRKIFEKWGTSERTLRGRGELMSVAEACGNLQQAAESVFHRAVSTVPPTRPAGRRPRRGAGRSAAR